MKQPTRREFLAYTAAGAGAAALPRSVAAANRATNEVRVGVIGCGWRGGGLIKNFGGIDGVRVAALCDADRARVDEHAPSAPHAFQTTDLRRVLDRNDIDAVVVSTCNHWHCLAAIWALEAGKHVYVEKPLFHNLWEGRRLVEAVDRHKKICQVGTQQRSDPMQTEIKRFLHEESALGAPRHVRVSRFGVRGPIGKRSEPLTLPGSVDFDLWCGPAEKQPIYRDELHYDWHWDWNTGSGEMGNWSVHIVDDVRNNVFQDRGGLPTRVVATGGRYVWNDAGDTPNLQLAVLETGSIPVSIAVCNLPAKPGSKERPDRDGPGSGYVVQCDGGRFEGRRGAGVAFDDKGKKIREFAGSGGMPEHAENFIAAVRSGDASALNAPAQVGFDSTAWCDLANIATRTATESAPGSALADQAFVQEELHAMRSVLNNFGLKKEADAFRLSAPLEFDSGSDKFVGEGADPANGYLKNEGRGPYRIA
ncbi:Gfo/Idh/MocA family oxidoreductase [Botrimarina sp.]|uniref:Gfo/Idh/MocA family protein n=1 Tax=Botrimarina sp. TaxID=2795802 RepID=UPI0032EDB326